MIETLTSLRFAVSIIFGGLCGVIFQPSYIITFTVSFIGSMFIMFIADYLPFNHIKVFNKKIKI